MGQKSTAIRRDYESFLRNPSRFRLLACTCSFHMATQSQMATTSSATSLAEIKTEAALAQPSAELGMESALLVNPLVARLPVEIDVAVPVRGFRVRNLLTLSAGTVIASKWMNGDDLPLGTRGAQLAWTEFEVIDQLLAVRITRLV
jgi:flagellar motor switch protein FliN/FliY